MKSLSRGTASRATGPDAVPSPKTRPEKSLNRQFRRAVIVQLETGISTSRPASARSPSDAPGTGRAAQANASVRPCASTCRVTACTCPR